MKRIVWNVELQGLLKTGHIECDLTEEEYRDLHRLDEEQQWEYLNKIGKISVDSYAITAVKPKGDFEAFKL